MRLSHAASFLLNRILVASVIGIPASARESYSSIAQINEESPYEHPETWNPWALANQVDRIYLKTCMEMVYQGYLGPVEKPTFSKLYNDCFPFVVPQYKLSLPISVPQTITPVVKACMEMVYLKASLMGVKPTLPELEHALPKLESVCTEWDSKPHSLPPTLQKEPEPAPKVATPKIAPAPIPEYPGVRVLPNGTKVYPNGARRALAPAR